MTKLSPKPLPPGKAVCPICGKPAQQETRPFCSRRCANIDLGRWLGGRYVVSDTMPDEQPEHRDEG